MYMLKHMEFDGFDWDEGNWAKCQRHGVSIEDIEALFTGPMRVRPDPTPSERRFQAIGAGADGRMIFCVFTWRNNRLIRPISARYMHRKEIASHEKEIP